MMIVWSGQWQAVVAYDSDTLRQRWTRSLPESLRPEALGVTNDRLFVADARRNVLVFSLPRLIVEATLTVPGDVAQFYSRGNDLVIQLRDDRYFAFDATSMSVTEVSRPDWCPARPRKTPPECPATSEAGFCVTSGISLIGDESLTEFGRLRMSSGWVSFAAQGGVQPAYVLGLDEKSEARWRVRLPVPNESNDYLALLRWTEAEVATALIAVTYEIHSRDVDVGPGYKAAAVDTRSGSLAWTADFPRCEGVRRFNDRLIGYRCAGPAPVVSIVDGRRIGELVPVGDAYP